MYVCVCASKHTSVNTQEAVAQERQGTTGTGRGYSAAARDAF